MHADQTHNYNKTNKPLRFPQCIRIHQRWPAHLLQPPALAPQPSSSLTGDLRDGPTTVTNKPVVELSRPCIPLRQRRPAHFLQPHPTSHDLPGSERLYTPNGPTTATKQTSAQTPAVLRLPPAAARPLSPAASPPPTTFLTQRYRQARAPQLQQNTQVRNRYSSAPTGTGPLKVRQTGAHHALLGPARPAGPRLHPNCRPSRNPSRTPASVVEPRTLRRSIAQPPGQGNHLATGAVK